MFKKLEPKKLRLDIQFPHCDQRILHALGECQFCDLHPEWQHLRLMWGIAFTGYQPEAGELPCPADNARGDLHKQWHGNVAVPLLGQVILRPKGCAVL
jgi:hypothetical protein